MLDFLLSQAQYAHFYILGLFFLAGFSFPVSEDVLFIGAAIIAVTVLPENTYLLFAACYIGAYFSDVICYTLGRTLGSSIVSRPPFNKLISKEKVDSMLQYYKKYGVATLFFGRFIPFGVRNAIFLTAGISKMSVKRFLLVDLIACTITSLILFNLGRVFAHNYEYLFSQIKQFNIVIIAVVVSGVVAFIVVKRRSANA